MTLTSLLTLAIVTSPASTSTAAIAGSPRATPGVYALDQEVLDAVLQDLVAYAGDDSPLAGRRVPLSTIDFAPDSLGAPLEVEGVLYRHEAKRWEGVTAALAPGLREAARDLVARTKRGAGFSGFRSGDSRIRARRPSADASLESLFGSRPVQAWPPGYSTDRSVAIVRLSIPWGMHSSEATYVITRGAPGWIVVVRQFIYYV